MTCNTRKDVYYAQQAAQCAAAAAITTIAEIKQAYLDLEQGWRHLFPEAMEGLGVPKVDASTATGQRK